MVLAACLFAAACDRPQAPGGGGQLGHYPPNTAQEPQPKFIRFIDGGDNTGRLETAIAVYEGEGGEKVELVGAVHIADAGYYARLAERFTTYDSLLYEMIKPDGAAPPGPGDRGGSLISLLQRGMGGGLELAYQIEAIDYGAENFVHADLDAETFREMSKERGQTLPKLLLQSAVQEFLSTFKDGGGRKGDPMLELKMLAAMFSKERARRLKYLFARELQDIEEVMAGLEKGIGGEESVILIERNKKAIEVLRERLSAGEKHIGVFYGGAHLPDLEERILREIGLRRTGVRWETAWLIE